MDELRSQYTAVETAFERFINDLTAVQDTAHETLLKFKQQRANAELKIAKHNQTLNEHKKISLDIGGTTFNTTEGTLLREEDSFFCAMLRSGQFQPDTTTGQYFIDRSPRMFEVILEYLRDGKLWLSDQFSSGERAMLRNDLDFYQITLPNQTVLWDVDMCAQINPDFDVKSSLSGDKKTVVNRTKRQMAFSTARFPQDRGFFQFHLTVEHNSTDLLTTRVELAKFGDTTKLLRLSTGEVEEINPVQLTCNLKPEFPSLDYSGAFSYTYKFCYDLKCKEIRITWPTGHAQKFKTDRTDTCLLLLSPGSDTSYTLSTEWDL
eukprot:TRINITY_DN67715_c5_g3_i2.p1 TRINITY_DN67715_c5_g3~~TRINITY_DN67715_c5_g3_i2.p1  ORF type:complete len:320 (-),score=14.63 TRINITY_DN67715_c5_g3_i2:188-1147(-)